jgi:hypothetical protein
LPALMVAGAAFATDMKAGSERMWSLRNMFSALEREGGKRKRRLRMGRRKRRRRRMRRRRRHTRGCVDNYHFAVMKLSF